MENHDTLLILLGGLAIGVGTLASAAYYFARYMIKTDAPEDQPQPQTEPSQPPPRPLHMVPEPQAPEAPSKPQAPPTVNSALKTTRESFWGKIQRSLQGEIQGPQLETLEEILYTSDLGPGTVTRLLDSVETQLSRAEKKSLDTIKSSLKSEVQTILDGVPKMGQSPLISLNDKQKPQVWMVVGVNGAGKTTTIGKLAFQAARQGQKVLVAAGDTFRAAAQSQLKVWTERAQVEIFAPENVTDPGAVAFDAVQMAKARGYDLVIIDTAGRLHTQDNLMEELKKVKRVIQKLDPEAPHETLIVLDANSGQNALIQAQKFHEALKLSGAVFTKMDGTAKGGVVLGLASQLQIPTVFLGIGESVEALTGFNPKEYAEALFEAQ
jgi:fused signal recognition particle receptor